MSNESKCPQCGALLPENAPAGLCPNCLMALNLKTETVFTDEAKAAQPPLPPEKIAPHFPQLEILECLGRGGMGVVYKARQKTLNRLVALKLLAPERVGDAKFAERFTREAQALAALNHPNIVTIYDFGQAGGFYFLLMEFVDGANLRQLLRARKFSPEEALAIVPPLCDALQFAHDRGIVHRDIKPENLLLDKSGRVKVADFGIAKMLSPANGEKAKEFSPPENFADATHAALGTPGYSAPEQKSDPARVDSRADIYSLGVVFYEMLTGELPGKKIEPPSKKVSIDVRLDEIVLRALEKNPELRYQHASVLKTQVETIAGCSGRESAQTESERAQSSQSRLTSAAAKIEPRFSRTAMVGACLFLFFILPIPILPFLASSGKHGEPAIRMLLLTQVFLFGLPSVFGTTILGWIAVSRIRRSEGKIYGMWLAVFDGLFFPLLALDFLIWYLCIVSTLIFRNGLDTSGRIHFATFALIVSVIISAVVDWLSIRRIWRLVNKPLVPALPPIQKPDHFWRWIAAAIVALISIPVVIAIFGLLTAIAIPNFVRARAQAQENARRAAQNFFDSTNFYIGQTSFPEGDSIEITSVERNENQMTVKGVYNLVSHEQADLALYITTTNNADNGEANVPEKFNQAKPAYKGRRTFLLMRSNVVPGLAHVSMYAGGKPFATIYFGTKAQADEESELNLQTAAAETWSPDLAAGEKPDLQKIYYSAKNLAADGSYEAALQRYLWYFQHSRTNDAQQGVRLSFALSDWIELGRLYPKARHALIEIRDDDVQKFSEGNGDFKLFQEVNSISHYLGDDDAAYALFQQIEQRDPRLAKQCFGIVESLLADHGDFQKCLDYIGDPQAAFERLRDSWQRMKSYEDSFAKRRAQEQLRLQEMAKTNSAFAHPFPEPPKFADQNFVGQVRLLIEILVATGHRADAEKIREEAVTVLDDPWLKSAVEDFERKFPGTEPNTGHFATEPNDLREARTHLAELRVNYPDSHPIIQRELAQIKELERLTKEEPNIPPDLRQAKAHLAELRVDFSEEHPEIQKTLARIKILEQNNISDVIPTLSIQPPVVVETFPISGARAVAAGEAEIRVRFSKEMANDSWSWSTAWENSTPDFIGQPHYEADGKTCVVKAKLEPDKTYAFWLNSENFQNFKDSAGRPAIPYLLIFQTKPK